MCDRIAILFPKGVDITGLEEYRKKHLLSLNLIQNQFLQDQVADIGQLVTGSHMECDCGTSLLFCSNNKEKILELRDQGYTDKDIEDWLYQQLDTLEFADVSLRTEFSRWVNVIADFVFGQIVEYLGLLIHYYEGDNNFTIKGRETLYIDDLKPHDIMKLERDILYLFKCGSKVKDS